MHDHLRKTDVDPGSDLPARSAGLGLADGVALPQLRVSIGVALFPEHGEETAEVIGAADDALYAAKNAGRDRYAFSAEVPVPTAKDEPGS